MKIGNFNISNLKLGTIQIKKVFIGLDLVWTSFLSIINDFKARVLSSQGEFEGETCLNNTLEDMGIDLFDQASLVITPNGYKETKLYTIKPNDNASDFITTRATIGTRVNSNGLIEEVPYNLFSQSETFENAYWTKQRTTVSTNLIAAPNDTMTADKVICNSGVTYAYTGSLGVNIVSSSFPLNPTERVVSFYLKYGGLNRIRVIYGGATTLTGGIYVEVDLQLGIITGSNGVFGSNTIASNFFIEDVGNGWYRVGFTNIMTLSTTNNRFAIGLGDTTKTVGDGVDGVFVWGAQLVNGTQPKDYFPVTNRFNIPRLDYDGDCPSILIETQMTNSWTNNNDTSGYATNTDAIKGATISNAFGEGFNGFEYNFNGGATFLSSSYSIRVFDTRTFPVQRLCIYIKNPSSDFFGINYGNVKQVFYQFSTLTAREYYTGSDNGKIVKINDDTYALFIYDDAAVTGQFSQVRVGFVNSLTNQNTVSGSAILGLGFQQSSATVNTLPDVYSSIVTTTSAVTRNIDYIYKDDIQDLIGQIEGSIYCEFSVKYSRNWNAGIFVLRSATPNERIAIRFNSSPGRPSGGYLNFVISAGGTFVVNLNAGTLIPTPNQRYKVCATYNQTEQKIYVNGVLVATRTGSYTNPSTLTTLQLGAYQANSISTTTNMNIYSGLVFKNVLTDAQAIQLTTL